MGKVCEHLRVVVRQKEAGIPARARVELIHQIRREQVRVAHHQRPLRLRRVRVEDRVDRIGVRSLQSGVLLEPVPDAVFRIDRVVDLEHDQILAVAVVQRLRPLVRAARAVKQVGRGLRTSQQRRHSHPADKRAQASACLQYCCRARTYSGRNSGSCGCAGRTVPLIGSVPPSGSCCSTYC